MAGPIGPIKVQSGDTTGSDQKWSVDITGIRLSGEEGAGSWAYPQASSPRSVVAGDVVEVRFVAHNINDTSKRCKVRLSVMGVAVAGPIPNSEVAIAEDIEIGFGLTETTTITMPVLSKDAVGSIVATIVPNSGSFGSSLPIAGKTIVASRKLLGQSAPSATTWTAVYSVPPGYCADAYLVIANRGGSASTFRIGLDTDASGTPSNAQIVAYDISLANADTWESPVYTLDEANRLMIYASSGDLSTTACGVEYAK